MQTNQQASDISVIARQGFFFRDPKSRAIAREIMQLYPRETGEALQKELDLAAIALTDARHNPRYPEANKVFYSKGITSPKIVWEYFAYLKELAEEYGIKTTVKKLPEIFLDAKQYTSPVPENEFRKVAESEGFEFRGYDVSDKNMADILVLYHKRFNYGERNTPKIVELTKKILKLDVNTAECFLKMESREALGVMGGHNSSTEEYNQALDYYEYLKELQDYIIEKEGNK